jgi:hypothetical protein
MTASNSKSSSSEEDDTTGDVSSNAHTPSNKHSPSKKGTDRRPAWLKFLHDNGSDLDSVQWTRQVVLDMLSFLREWAMHDNSLSSGLELIGVPDSGAGQELGWRIPGATIHVSKVGSNE